MDERATAVDVQESPTARALTHLERLLDRIVPALPDADDEAGREALALRIDQYRRALAGRDMHALRTSGEALLKACRDAADNHTQMRAARRAEMADLVNVFRDLTINVMGEGTTLTADMTTAAARFAALGKISDLKLLKERLASEVIRLKQQSRAKEEKWQTVANSFRQQVAVLEAELVATREEASLDPLTGVANRRRFDRRLADLIKDHSRHFALALVDLDHFKNINDQHGHDAGDGVLQAIADTFAGAIRSDDIIARIGGDEFAVILQNVTLSQAVSRVSAITLLVARTLKERGLSCASVSCGVAEFAAGDTAQTLMKRADDALYESKRQGPGHVSGKAAEG